VEALMSQSPGDQPLKPADGPPAIYGPDGKPQFFTDPAMDRFAAAFTVLAQEVWVIKEALANLAEAADAKGAVTRADIDAVLAAGGDARRDAGMQAFVHRVLGPVRED
jgi:hypothetical protein